jgi:hypothetical protein
MGYYVQLQANEEGDGGGGGGQQNNDGKAFRSFHGAYIVSYMEYTRTDIKYALSGI